MQGCKEYVKMHWSNFPNLSLHYYKIPPLITLILIIGREPIIALSEKR